MSLPYPQNGLERTSTVDFDEQLKLALALSASEAEHLRGNQHGRNQGAGPQTAKDSQEDDFKLAMELQTREHGPEEGPSSGKVPSRPQSKVARPVGADLCAGCGKDTGFAYVTALGKNWHTKCFKCGGCRKPLDGAYIAKDGEPYHEKCHTTLFHEKCVVCHNRLPSQGNRIVWSEHPFWREKYCQEHNEDGTEKCSGCERCQARGADWLRLEDGRKLCTDCQETIVVDTPDCQPLYKEIRQMYCELNLPFLQEPPLALVDQLALNEAKTGTHGGSNSQTRGMTLTEVSRPLRKWVQRGRSRWFPEMVPIESHECNVTAILVLYGLPRLLTGSILAHEMMHAWLKFNLITDLSQDVEEGLCQLMGLIWLERQQTKDGHERRLASFIGNQIRTHPCHIYGDGFRAAHESFQCYGLKSLVDHVRQTGAFPVPQTST